ncbi:hypothetical protein Hanom_Chr11g00990561 [Helianthus anomalus]
MHLQGRRCAAKGLNKGSLMMLEPVLNLMVFSRQQWCMKLVPFEETLYDLELLENINTFDHLFWVLIEVDGWCVESAISTLLGALTGALIGQERENECVSCFHLEPFRV